MVKIVFKCALFAKPRKTTKKNRDNIHKGFVDLTLTISII